MAVAKGAPFRLSLDGETELVERLFENFHTDRRIRKGRIAARAGQDLLADGKNSHGAGVPKAEPDSMAHAVYTVREVSVLRTGTIGSLITIIFSVSKLIVFGCELIFLRPEMIMSGAKKIISSTKIIMLRSDHIASLPDPTVFEAKTIVFKPEMIVSKLEIILSTTTKTACGLDLTAPPANKTATVTEKTATVATNTATIVKNTATVGHARTSLKLWDSDGL